MVRTRTERSPIGRTPARTFTFPLLGRIPWLGPRGASPRTPIESARAAWRKSRTDCLRLERSARAALREPPAAFGPRTEALFDLVAESDFLPIVAPRGRLPKDFVRRCLAVARERKIALAAEREALVLGTRLSRRWNAARLRRRDTIPWLAPDIDHRSLARLALLARSYPGEPDEGLARGELAIPGVRLTINGNGAIRRRETVPGSDIVLGVRDAALGAGTAKRQARPYRTHAHEQLQPHHRVRRSPESPADHAGARLPKASTVAGGAIAGRLGRALAIVEAAWPEAAWEIRRRTRQVLTLDEPGLVSYSLPSRPGVSFINVRGKSLLDLADDLLHETAHHRLHAIEDACSLFRKMRGSAGKDEPRFWSPWRRARRPLRGLFHAAYTFAFRAELFDRILRVARANAGRVGPATLRKSALSHLAAASRTERRWIARSLRDLEGPVAHPRLTPAGRRVLASIRRTVSRRSR